MTILNQPTAVVDTNVLLSSFLSRYSTAYTAIETLGRIHKILLSSETEDEIREVVRRPKFDKYIPLPQRLSLLAKFIGGASLITVSSSIRACRDPGDDKFLACAVDGEAELILTGDADLLALHTFRGIAILTPAAYLASVGVG